MIKGFRCKETAKIFARQFSKHFPQNVQRIAYRKIMLLDAAESLDDLLIPPGNRLEKLTGNRKGQYSIRINDQWRICFKWQKKDVYEVEITDYH